MVSRCFRAFVYEGFLTELECDHIVSLVSFSSSFHLSFELNL